MTTGGKHEHVAARYVAFADDEARGASPVYEALARAVAGSHEILSFLTTLPAARRQPNLFLAAVRSLHGVPDSADHLIEIVRRHGGPLRNPLDLRSEADAGWLETLVWPGQAARAERLRAAMAIARQDPPRIETGNLLDDLERVLAQAPSGATPVVFHTAVLAYVPAPADRARFADAVRRAGAVWISNEAPGVFPHLAAAAPAPPARGLFLLAMDGTPVAWTGPHGQSIDWFGA